MIRNYMRTFFPKLVDILFVLTIIGVLIWAATMAKSVGTFNAVAGFGTFLVTAIGGIVGSTLSFGVIYLLLDIRDSLQDKKE